MTLKSGTPVTVNGVIASDLIRIPLKNGHKFIGYKVKMKGYDEPILFYESEVHTRHTPHQYITDTDLDETRTYLSKNLRSFRMAKNITQLELAELVGVFENSINNWECGRNSPRMEKLLRISAVLDCTVEELVTTELRFDR